MSHKLRIGARVGSADPFWVQLRESIQQRAHQLGVDLVEIDRDQAPALSGDAQSGFLERLAAYDLDALITAYLPEPLAWRILAGSLPIIHLTESSIRHPRLVALGGYYAGARMAGAFLAERLGRQGRVLAVGGLRAGHGEDGRSRLAGITDSLAAHPRMELVHVPSAWRYEHAYPEIHATLRTISGIDAIFGFSDSIAIAARDSAAALGLLTPATLVVGFNGDPRALAAIAERTMTATIDTAVAEFGFEAVDLACQAARGAPLPAEFVAPTRLITQQNVAEAAMHKLIAIADLPSRLVGVNHRRERQRLTLIETSRAINRLIGLVDHRRLLANEIVELIRSGYGFDTAQLYFWHERERVLALNAIDAPQRAAKLAQADAGILGQAAACGEAINIADTRHSYRFAPDPRCPEIRSRVVLPVRAGRALQGVLDLHSRQPSQRTEEDLGGLQLLADQLGLALRNADLAQDVRVARAARGSEHTSHTGELVGRAVTYIQRHHARDLSRQEIAAHIGVSENYLTQIFHRDFGMSPWEYLHRYRVERAKAFLRDTDQSISAVAAAVGFGDPAYFSRVFRKLEGCAPRDYREQA